jgi:hypothetical protein
MLNKKSYIGNWRTAYQKTLWVFRGIQEKRFTHGGPCTRFGDLGRAFGHEAREGE